MCFIYHGATVSYIYVLDLFKFVFLLTIYVHRMSAHTAYIDGLGEVVLKWQVATGSKLTVKRGRQRQV